jgi:hypothetical protein
MQIESFPLNERFIFQLEVVASSNFVELYVQSILEVSPFFPLFAPNLSLFSLILEKFSHYLCKKSFYIEWD